MIELSDAALRHLKKQFAKSNEAVAYVFLTKRSGCSGFAYVLDLVAKALDLDQYEKVDFAGLPFYIEKKSAPYFKGLLIDFKQEGLQSRLIYVNPNEAGRCGCGESFSINEN